MLKFDAVVIGSGVAGLSAAYKLKDAGKKVAIIEEDLWGGTCPNRGCDPKKILIAGVEARDRVNQLVGKGFSELAPMNWEEIEAFKRSFTDPVPESRQKGLADYGVTTIYGQARFTDANHITVNDEEIEAAQFLIATGQRANLLNLDGQEYLSNSTDFLALSHMPKRMAVIGGGYIAFELATIANAAGSEVTIILHNRRPLKEFDAALVDEMVAQLKERGIRFVYDTDIKKIVKTDEGYHLSADDTTLEADFVLCATGRIPNVEELNLEAAQVEYSKKGINVNDYLQTSAENIYACGDVLAKTQPRLTPVSTFEGEYAVSAMLGNQTPISYSTITTIVYGSPKLAKVGVTIEGDGIKMVEQDLTAWFTYQRLNEPTAKAKLYFDQDNQLVGATTLSGQADELINYLAMVIDQKISHDTMKDYIIGYPTVASDLAYLV
ncbi:dihydrolipoyl dehydrogenase family protein [Enterococcus sp. LJL120]